MSSYESALGERQGYSTPVHPDGPGFGLWEETRGNSYKYRENIQNS